MLKKPTTGTITVKGLGAITANRRVLRKHRLRTGMVFQQYQLIGRHAAVKNVLVGRIGHYATFRSILPLATNDQASVGHHRNEHRWHSDCDSLVGSVGAVGAVGCTERQP